MPGSQEYGVPGTKYGAKIMTVSFFIRRSGSGPMSISSVLRTPYSQFRTAPLAVMAAAGKPAG